MTISYEYTAGRVLPGSSRRGKKQSIDTLLRLDKPLPVAIVYQQRPEQSKGNALEYLEEVARRLSVLFAYLFDANGSILECDWTANPLIPHYLPVAEVLEREALRGRWHRALQLDLESDRAVLEYPYKIVQKQPRYYQEAAINNALIAVLQAWCGLRKKRILITLATGTGKTMVAFQLLWKLKQSEAIRKALCLADRTYLLEQACLCKFAPFNEAVVQGKGEIKTSRDIIFGSYQWFSKEDDLDISHLSEYEPNFFDVIIVDEYHRGSTNEKSSWRQVLEYFTSAIQVGMTATPLDNGDVQTKEYLRKRHLYLFTEARDHRWLPGILLGAPPSSNSSFPTINSRPNRSHARSMPHPCVGYQREVKGDSRGSEKWTERGRVSVDDESHL